MSSLATGRRLGKYNISARNPSRREAVIVEDTPTKVLVTVITYPHPSRGYQELVCTAGITEESEWLRLYPVDYRYLPRHQQFHKYQWISVKLGERGKGNDNRKESRRPDLDSISILGEPLSTENKWADRRALIDKMPHHTINQLCELFDTERKSLGVRRKFLDEMCRQDKETRFFMGTRFPYNTWLVVGVFWLPKVLQRQLF
jgi:hypothetical protein